MKWHFVYLISHLDKDGCYIGPVKVGISQNWQARAKGIQTASPNKVVPIFCFSLPTRELARSIESDIHRCFGDRRTHGEWFDVIPVLALTYAAKIVEAHLANVLGTETLPAHVVEKSGLKMAFDHLNICQIELAERSAQKEATIQ